MTDGIVQSPNQSCISPGVAEQYTLRNGMGLAHQEQVLRLEVCGRRGAGRGRVWKRAGKEAAEGNPTRTFVTFACHQALAEHVGGMTGPTGKATPFAWLRWAIPQLCRYSTPDSRLRIRRAAGGRPRGAGTHGMRGQAQFHTGVHLTRRNQSAVFGNWGTLSERPPATFADGCASPSSMLCPKHWIGLHLPKGPKAEVQSFFLIFLPASRILILPSCLVQAEKIRVRIFERRIYPFSTKRIAAGDGTPH